jgi:choline dehydrogenase
MKAIDAAREVGRQTALDAVREAELIPRPKAGAAEVHELARLGSASFGHAVGTSKIGADEMAVVDPQLRVHGIQGLRVADSSVVPRIPTAPTNAASFMVAGKAAQVMLA